MNEALLKRKFAFKKLLRNVEIFHIALSFQYVFSFLFL